MICTRIPSLFEFSAIVFHWKSANLIHSKEICGENFELVNDEFRIIVALPADDMVWFVFQVLRSSEAEFNQNQRKDILERMTQIFSFGLDPFSTVLNNISIDYFGKCTIPSLSFHIHSFSHLKNQYGQRTTFTSHMFIWFQWSREIKSFLSIKFTTIYSMVLLRIRKYSSAIDDSSSTIRSTWRKSHVIEWFCSIFLSFTFPIV